MKNYNLPASLLCDFYKISHKEQYPEETEMVYSTFTARTSRNKDIKEVVAFGFQAFIKQYLIEYFEKNFFNKPQEEIIKEYERVIKYCLGVENPDSIHIVALHNLGYLPLKIKSVKEGSLIPIRVPMLTIENTKPEFYWLTNYIETLFSCSVWQSCTSATTAFEFKKILEKYAMQTVGNTDFTPFQGHDFSLRGQTSLDSGMSSGAGHLLSFVGTDTIPAILFHERYYNADIESELVGTSIPATEHSVMCSYGKEGEFNTYKRFINEVYPNGMVSIVSDTWDFWKVLNDVIVPLKEDILKRDGKIVIRPDSGNPVDILCGNIEVIDLTNNEHCANLDDCKRWMKNILVDKVRDNTPHGEHGCCEAEGVFKFQNKYYKIKVSIEWDRYDKQYYYIYETYVKSCEETELTLDQKGAVEVLWDIFGGTVNELGYKELDSHIGTIYGDAINLDRCEQICEKLKQKGFASTNVVFGIGAYSYQFVTRDTFGFAVKSTCVRVNGEERQIFKDPKTDNGVKKSQKGMVAVIKTPTGIACVDELNSETIKKYNDLNLLEDVFVDGKLVRDESLSEIRNRLQNHQEC